MAFPFHEPTHPRPFPGGEQASVGVLSVPLLGGARGGFKVPMHAQKHKEALHEPPAKAGASSTHSKRCRAVAERLGPREAFGVRPACRRFPRFMVPMHAQKRAVFLARFAFTLIELLVVIAIIAILAGLLL